MGTTSRVMAMGEEGVYGATEDVPQAASSVRK